MNHDALLKAMDKAKKSMEKAAADLNFIEAARFRDEMLAYKELLATR
jgi:excinuclease ABC subunit B